MKAIWNRRWWILTTILAVLTATLWWANGLPRVYESSVILSYSPSNGGLTEPIVSSVNDRLWSEGTLRPLIEGDLFQEQRSAGVAVARIVENLSRNSAVQAESTTLLRIRYRDRSPERARKIANSLGAVVSQLPAQSGQGTFMVQTPASAATIQIGPRRFVLLVFALGIGALLGLVIAGIAELSGRFRAGKFADGLEH